MLHKKKGTDLDKVHNDRKGSGTLAINVTNYTDIIKFHLRLVKLMVITLLATYNNSYYDEIEYK